MQSPQLTLALTALGRVHPMPIDPGTTEGPIFTDPIRPWRLS
jgi:hypothetical protein